MYMYKYTYIYMYVYIYTYIYIYISRFELVKQNQFGKISECSEEKDLPQAKKLLDLQIIL